MNFNQTEVYLSSHSLDHTLIEATLSASAGIEDTVDAWLSRSDLLVRSYQDYVRFDLDVPIDTNQTMAIQKAVRILVPEYKTLFIGNTEKRIRIEQLQGTLHIAQRAGPIEIHGAGPLVIQQSGAPLLIEGFEGGIEIESAGAPLEPTDVIGAVRMTASFQPVNINRVSGHILVDAVNSSIKVTGLTHFPVRRRIELATTDSTITVALPDSAHAFVEVTTTTGYIISDYPLYYMNEAQSHARLYLGVGRTRIRLSTGRGDILIKNSISASPARPR